MGKRRGEGGDGVREDEGGSIFLVQTENCRCCRGETLAERLKCFFFLICNMFLFISSFFFI